MFDNATHFVFTLTDTVGGIEIPDWAITSAELGIKSSPSFSVQKRTLHGGRQEGSTTITVRAGHFAVTLVPTRGMNIFNVTSGPACYGWASPVDEIVNPAYVNLTGRAGLGWLEGFNEMMVRCGFEWTGHPVTDEPIRYTLHGRAGSTPASQVVVAIERAAPHRITVAGLIKEKAFKLADYETWATVSLVPGETRLSLADTLTNLSDYERPYQIIYHTNFGRPVLEQDASIVSAMARVAPFGAGKDASPAWDRYLGPTRDYDEFLFIGEPMADASGRTAVALVNATSTLGVMMSYPVAELPVFTLWKNTDTERQGYVTGLEPGTNFPYRRPLEEKAGRVRKLAPGAATSFHIDIDFLGSATAVTDAKTRIAAIAAGRQPVMESEPVYLPK